MVWWVGPLIQLTVLVALCVFLFWRGPKGRFGRLRCAIYGQHVWDTQVTVNQGEGEETHILITTIAIDCLICGEHLQYEGRMGIEHYEPPPVGGKQN